MNAALLGALLGGVGLFLLGMRLMTDGLKLAAGPALRHILGKWTRTPARGLAAGALVTALVQSSSAVTVATIGFVNAGLLSLAQSVGVIYGANLGTTMTSWLVALVGFRVDLRAVALPLIGVGVALRVAGSRSRGGGLGDALAGFGLFFLGVEVLKGAFEDLGRSLPLDAWAGDGGAALLAFVGIGFLLTLLMQSSSAAIAIILTATLGDVVPLPSAAAALIGANVGTTSTAALAVIGATPGAKRVAAAHVLFNVVVAVAALALLPAVLWLVSQIRELLSLEDNPAATLAVFHTVSKLLGIAIMAPLTSRLVPLLERRFRTPEEDEGQPRYLDRNVLATPTLALDAMALELTRIGTRARAAAASALAPEDRATAYEVTADRRVVEQLVNAVGRFSAAIQRANLPQHLDQLLPDGLRVARYYLAVVELADECAQARARTVAPLDPTLLDRVRALQDEAAGLLSAADPAKPAFDVADVERRLTLSDETYQALKGQLLRAGADGRLAPAEMVEQLEFYSRVRRMLQQAAKGALRLRRLAAAARGGDVPPASDGDVTD